MLIEHNPSLCQPIEFDGQVPQSLDGISTDGVKNIITVFERQIDDELHPGAQLVVLRNGHVVVDLYGGYTDLGKRQLVNQESPFMAFSITKPLISACVFRLIDNGQIELDAPVEEYWPEYGTKGKEKTTIRQVLLHQAGIPRRGLLYQIKNVSDWEKVTQNIANQKSVYPPGSKTAYHTLNFGYILGEIVRRVSGRPIEEYLNTEFLIPMGLHHTDLKIKDLQDKSYPHLYSGTIGHQFVAWLFNSPNFRQAVIPASSLHSTARDLAIIFQMFLNEGFYAGKKYLQPESINLATSLAYEGIDESLGRTTRWGYGFHIGGDHELNPTLPDGMGYRSSVNTFGHFGQRTSMAWADKSARLVVVFLCNRFLSGIDYKKRLQEISDAVWSALDE